MKLILRTLLLLGLASMAVLGANKYSALIPEIVANATGKATTPTVYVLRNLDTLVSGDTLFLGGYGITATNRVGYRGAILNDAQSTTCKDSIVTLYFAVSKDADAQNVERYTQVSPDGITWSTKTLAAGDTLVVGSTSGTIGTKRYVDEYIPGYYYREYVVQKDATDNTHVRGVRKWLKRTCP